MLATDRSRLEEERAGLFGGRTLVRREPVGVAAAIVPWNFPQGLTASKIAPALAAGCVVVLKPAPETVLDAFVLAEAAMAAGLPAGVLNIVPAGREIGEYLVTHPGVDKVSFTGSTAAGRRLAELCGRLLRPITLELGGKSAAIVLDDADLTGAAPAFVNATLLNSGRTCMLSTRILAPQSRYDEVVDFLSSTVRSLTVGDSLDPHTQTLVAKMPASLDFVQAGGLPLAGLTALQALHDGLGVAKGDRLYISGGGGGVGSMAIPIAKWMGAEVATTASGRGDALVRARAGGPSTAASSRAPWWTTPCSNRSPTTSWSTNRRHFRRSSRPTVTRRPSPRPTHRCGPTRNGGLRPPPASAGSVSAAGEVQVMPGGRRGLC